MSKRTNLIKKRNSRPFKNQNQSMRVRVSWKAINSKRDKPWMRSINSNWYFQLISILWLHSIPKSSTSANSSAVNALEAPYLSQTHRHQIRRSALHLTRPQPHIRAMIFSDPTFVTNCPLSMLMGLGLLTLSWRWTLGSSKTHRPKT